MSTGGGSVSGAVKHAGHSLWSWVVDGGLAPLIVGLALLAVPTVYTLFAPEVVAPVVGASSFKLRVLVGAIWAAFAVIAIIRQGSLDRRMQRVLGGRLDERAEVVRVAVDEILGALVDSGTQGTPMGFSWRVFVFDDVRALLLPLYPAGSDTEVAELSFKSGDGAAGRAFRDGGIVVVLGDAVSNTDYGLTTEQQTRFARYKSVAAAQMSWEGHPMGSLCAISESEDGYFSTAPGRAVLFRLADTVAAVLAVMLGIGIPPQ
jgi:hypothetical protein